ncbi:MAG TPA: hypothetical protein VNT79_07680, partial [Phycisphaerae bacterium]|nr:hypothetical protein [Phycisphaerae bacterium]
LGSPKYPGAGTHDAWWAPDQIFDFDMSNLYAHHDEEAIMDGGPSAMPGAAAREFRIYLESILRARDPIHVLLTITYCIGLFPAMMYHVASNPKRK